MVLQAATDAVRADDTRRALAKADAREVSAVAEMAGRSTVGLTAEEYACKELERLEHFVTHDVGYSDGIEVANAIDSVLVYATREPMPRGDMQSILLTCRGALTAMSENDMLH